MSICILFYKMIKLLSKEKESIGTLGKDEGCLGRGSI